MKLSQQQIHDFICTMLFMLRTEKTNKQKKTMDLVSQLTKDQIASNTRKLSELRTVQARVKVNI
jgi:hypothetical protein